MKKSVLRMVPFVIVMILCFCAVGVHDISYAAAKKPAKVKITKVTVNESNEITVKWKRAKGAGSYQIYAKAGESRFQKVKTQKKPKYRMQGEEGTVYSFKVRALKGKKKGKFSKVKSVETNILVEVSREDVVLMAVDQMGIGKPEEEEIQYSYEDVSQAREPELVESAYRAGLVPENPSKFEPKKAATREFASYVFTKAGGFHQIEQGGALIGCDDEAWLRYPFDDYIAYDTGLFQLIDNSFEPSLEVTSEEFSVFGSKLQEELTEPVVPDKIEESIVYKTDVKDMSLSEETIDQIGVSSQEGKYGVDYQIQIPADDADRLKEGKVYHLFYGNGEDAYVLFKVMKISMSSSENPENAEQAEGKYTLVYQFPPIENVIKEYSLTGTQDEGSFDFIPEKGINIENDSSMPEGNKGKTKTGSIPIGRTLSLSIEPYTIMKYIGQGLDDDPNDCAASVSLKIDKLRYKVDYGFGGLKSAYMAIDTNRSIKFEIGAKRTIKGSFINDINEMDDMEIKLGSVMVPIGSTPATLRADIYLKITYGGKIVVEATTSGCKGFTYKKSQPFIKTYSKTYSEEIKAGVTCTAKAGFEPKASLCILNYPLVSAAPYAGVGITGSATHTEGADDNYSDGTCYNLKFFPFLELTFSIDVLEDVGVKASETIVIFGEKNSQKFVLIHLEDGKIVDQCTRVHITPPVDEEEHDSSEYAITTFKVGNKNYSKKFRKLKDKTVGIVKGKPHKVRNKKLVIKTGDGWEITEIWMEYAAGQGVVAKELKNNKRFSAGKHFSIDVTLEYEYTGEKVSRILNCY